MGGTTGAHNRTGVSNQPVCLWLVVVRTVLVVGRGGREPSKPSSARRERESKMGDSVAGVATTTFAVLGYAGCSSIMLVINKLCVHMLPAPSFVLLAQVTASWVAVRLAGATGAIDVDELEWKKLRAFFPVAIAFLACIFANIKTLQYANVESERHHSN